METINIRYGSTLNFQVETDDSTATEVTMYIGNVGELPILSVSGSFNELGVATLDFTEEDTRLPLGTYNYQINVLTSDGGIEKYPNPEDCEDGELPKFVVYEALDETEVVS